MEELRVGQPSEALTFGYNARIKLRRAKRLSKVQTYGNYLRVLQDISFEDIKMPSSAGKLCGLCIIKIRELILLFLCKINEVFLQK